MSARVVLLVDGIVTSAPLRRPVSVARLYALTTGRVPGCEAA